MPKSYYFQRIMGCWQNLKSPSLNFSFYQHFNKKTIYDTLKIVACKIWNGVAILLGDGRWTPKLWASICTVQSAKNHSDNKNKEIKEIVNKNAGIH